MARGWITALALLLLSAQGNARPDCENALRVFSLTG
jgi:hypothetical protein